LEFGFLNLRKPYLENLKKGHGSINEEQCYGSGRILIDFTVDPIEMRIRIRFRFQVTHKNKVIKILDPNSDPEPEQERQILALGAGGESLIMILAYGSQTQELLSKPKKATAFTALYTNVQYRMQGSISTFPLTKRNHFGQYPVK
jgi:hypothetical protein